MALDFKFADFAHPVDILRLRRQFEVNPWRETGYAEERLRAGLRHAYDRVPYYRRLFDEHGFRPETVSLKRLPLLSKRALRENFPALRADNHRRFSPRLQTTSGTTGAKVSFLADRPSNVLEFVYYWRHWGSAGYRLGRPFAELATVFFRGRRTTTHFQRSTRRLLLNATRLSEPVVLDFVRAIRAVRPAFLKGLPSALTGFSRLLERLGIDDIRFATLFTTGELLLANQRRELEARFGGRVLDSYGHMERTVAISECPAGGRHVNTDYGWLEVLEDGSVVGTSLHNRSMPLIRYELGDRLELERPEVRCPCGRIFPLVKRILGRRSDTLVTPEGHYVTAPFLVFEEVEGIGAAQLVQDSPAQVRARIVPTRAWNEASESGLRRALAERLGPSVSVAIEPCTFEELEAGREGKLPVVLAP